MPQPSAGDVTEGRCDNVWGDAICLAIVFGDGTGNWGEMELEVMCTAVIWQHNSRRLQMNCDVLSYQQKGCNGNSDLFENAVASSGGAIESFLL